MKQYDSYYVEMARTVARISRQGVYIADLEQRRFIYSSPHPLLRCGMCEEEFNRDGFSGFHRFLPADEVPMLEKFVGKVSSNYQRIPLGMRSDFVMALNFHIIANGRRVMVMHKLSLLDFNDEGNPRLLIGMVTPSVHDSPGKIIMGISGTEHFYHYRHESDELVKIPIVHFTDEELEMLRFTMQGFSMEQIGDFMGRTVDTVKFYRRNVFSKLKVKNISEAISYATTYCLI